MRQKLKAVNVNRLISGIAFIVSVGTLFTFVYQTKLIREHQYATVMPYLEIWNTSKTEEFSINLYNRGLGPAFIEKVNIIHNGKKYHKDIQKYLEMKKIKTPPITYTNIKKGMVIKEDMKIPLIHFALNSQDEERKKFLKLLGKIQLEITYRSIYGERWKVKKYETPFKLEN